MQLIIFTPPLNIIGHNLHQEMQDLADQVQLHTFGDIPSLAAHLRQPMRVETICILIPADNHDLLGLSAIRHLMRDMRLIVILPNRHARTISEGHSLRPRFVSYVDCPSTDVAAVVRKMIHSTRSLERAEHDRCVPN
jgi:hypothetical protein